MKIVQHAKKCHPTLVTGQLLGLEQNSVLEVTFSFPFSNKSLGDVESEESDLR
jgi:hypothetical protein